MSDRESEDDDGPKDFFISYAGPDRPWAVWVGYELESAGYSVELDIWDWRPGDNFIWRMNNGHRRGRRSRCRSRVQPRRPAVDRASRHEPWKDIQVRCARWSVAWLMTGPWSSAVVTTRCCVCGTSPQVRCKQRWATTPTR
jgi:hypothetical protein